MLALTRHRGESVMLGDDVEVQVVDVKGERVKLGFTAPRNVPIYRKEVWLKIKAEEAEGTGK